MNIQPLTTCEKEPIHILSKIQQLGVLCVVTYNEYKIIQVSDNFHTIFKNSEGSPINHFFKEFVCSTTIAKLDEIIKERENPLEKYTYHYTQEKSNLFFVIHLEKDYIIVEVSDSHTKEDDLQHSTEDIVATAINHCETILTFDELLNAIVQSVHTISGYDRVLLYKFDEDANGTVLAEYSQNFEESYLHHRFPASDIPSQARALYLKNRFRIIENVDEENAILSPTLNPLTNQPLDMSMCYLRSVSPIHIEYLKNMQVQSSMSLSIVIEGKLWGLIACHNTKPKTIPLALYPAYYLLSNLFSAQINQKEIFTNYKEMTELQLAREIFLTSLNGRNRRSFYEALEEEFERLQKIVLADESIVFENNQIMCHNSQLSDDEIKHIFEVAKQNQNADAIFTTSNLIQFIPNILEYSKIIGGVLLFKIPIKNKELHLLFLKYEQITNVTWAGDPNKVVTYKEDGQIVINPRASFESWKEVVRGTSSPIKKIAIDSGKSIVQELVRSIELFKMYDEAKKMREENKTFQEQKLIAMGEMMNNIAHQWRQPLNVITTVASGIQMKQEFGIFKAETLQNDMEKIIFQSDYLSKTIDDFTNFLKNTDNTQRINIKKVLECTILIVQSTLASDQIKLIHSLNDDAIIEGCENELVQAFINIINNAKDAINEQSGSLDKKLIFITTSKNNDGLEISIKDNGGGIKDEIMPRIFEPYFTTKHKSIGTGIGLSMAHKILVQRHNANIHVENIEYSYGEKEYKGACFTISFFEVI